MQVLNAVRNLKHFQSFGAQSKSDSIKPPLISCQISSHQVNKLKNTLTDLNNHLFTALERLNEENLAKEKYALEIERSKAICLLAKEITNNAQLVLDAKLALHRNKDLTMPLLENAK